METQYLYVKTQIEKKPHGGGKFTIIRQFTGITGIYWCFIELESDGKPKVLVEGRKSPPPGEERLFVLNCRS